MHALESVSTWWACVSLRPGVCSSPGHTCAAAAAWTRDVVLVSDPWRGALRKRVQEEGGKELVLLAIYVNEYGADSPPPNTGRIYVECMDGVPLRRGERGLHREALVARIFTAYLDYVRSLGFSFVHFRAPPPHDDHCQIFARCVWAGACAAAEALPAAPLGPASCDVGQSAGGPTACLRMAYSA